MAKSELLREACNDTLGALFCLTAIWLTGMVLWYFAPFTYMGGAKSLPLESELVWDAKTEQFVSAGLATPSDDLSMQTNEEHYEPRTESVLVIRNGGFQAGAIDRANDRKDSEVAIDAIQIGAGHTVALAVNGGSSDRPKPRRVRSAGTDLPTALVHTIGECVVYVLLLGTFGMFMATPGKTLFSVVWPSVKSLTWQILHRHGDTRKGHFVMSLDQDSRVDVAILTVKEEEYTAMYQRLERCTRIRYGQRDYATTTIRAREMPIRVALGRITEQGERTAHARAIHMVQDLNPRWLLLVGIAGGFPDWDYSLGDVILSSRIHDFEVGSALEGGAVEFSNRGGPIHPDVEGMVLEHLPLIVDEMGDWDSPERVGDCRPHVKLTGKGSVELYGPSAWQESVHQSLKVAFVDESDRRPRAIARSIATSSKLIKDTELARRYREASRDAAAVEMELGGVYDAAREFGTRDTRVLAIRGISDIVGLKRSAEWTSYACNVAAAFAFGLIRHGILR